MPRIRFGFAPAAWSRLGCVRRSRTPRVGWRGAMPLPALLALGWAAVAERRPGGVRVAAVRGVAEGTQWRFDPRAVRDADPPGRPEARGGEAGFTRPVLSAVGRIGAARVDGSGRPAEDLLRVRPVLRACRVVRTSVHESAAARRVHRVGGVVVPAQTPGGSRGGGGVEPEL